MLATPLLKIDGLVTGLIIKRPSKIIKTPYVADVRIGDTDIETLGHTASLGCCGLADVGATILMAPVPKPRKPTDKIACKYKVYLSMIRERDASIVVGIHPKLAEDLTEAALKNNLLTRLLGVRRYKRETAIYVEGKVDSRFDFSGIDCNGVPFIMEVKNVPLADYEDITAKDRKGKCYDDRPLNSKVAYFPDGYRKKSTDTVSPRAVKHLAELALIKKESITRCILCFVIQRSDVDRFQASNVDPEYAEALKNAMSVGVEVIRMVVHWSRDGQATFVRDDLPLFIP